MKARYFPTEPIVYCVVTVIIMTVNFYMDSAALHKVIGCMIAIPAFVLWIIARLQLGANFSLGARAKSLVTTGLYAKLRHPVYVCSVLVLFGISLFFNAWYLYVLTLGLLTIQLIRRHNEEKVLLDKFQEKYREYQKTSWF